MSSRRLRLRVFVVALALLTAGCGGESGADGERAEPVESTTTTSVSVSSTTTTPVTTTTTTPATSSTTTTTATPEPVPEWAPASMSRAELDQMLVLIEADLDARSIDYLWLDGGVEIDGSALGFTNLAGSLLASDETFWADLVAEHFDGILQALNQTVSPDWSVAAPNLRIRMKGTEEVQGVLSGGVYEEIAQGLFNVAFYDFPDTSALVTTTMLEDWGVSGAEVRSVALANTLAEPGVETFVDTSTGFDLVVVVGGFYGATNVNALDGIVELEPGVGAIVSVPTSDTILVHPIVDQAVITNLFVLGQLTEAWWADGPGSASPEIYWYRDGTISRLDLVIGDGTGRLDSIELTELVETLPPG
ncbi:MAG: hypothetical protein AAGE98_16460 [Actinomycetota bacterium]